MNKSAIVVGGSNGLGLALVVQLIKKGYYVYIFDKVEPDSAYLMDVSNYEYIFCDLSYFDESIFKDLIINDDVDLLMITAGFGRVARFEYLDYIEIEKQFKVNTLSIIHIIHLFYDRIVKKNNFYVGIMCSIAGIVSSPLFSTYSASKGALVKFIEAINIELEKKDVNNRILAVSPGSINGTKFNGSECNDLNQTSELAKEILEKMRNHETIFIPKYDEIFKNVVDNYIKNPHEFGIKSYDYKIKSGRIDENKRTKIGYLSGTFDLFHVGHLNLLKNAKMYCDYLIVGVHPDATHKGKQTFISFEDRKEIVNSCKYVDKVVDSCAEDSDAWNLYHYDFLFVGSDYKGTERFNRYEKYFEDKNVDIIYFPYTTSISSTKIREKIIFNTKNVGDDSEKH